MEEKLFNDYVKNFDMSDIGIKLKYEHSYRVRDLSVKYAKKLGFEKRDVYLASVIGLLHDIGRFKQWTIYKTFDDTKSLDHGDLAIEILFGSGLINSLDLAEEEKEIVRFAIKNHNKLSVEETSDERKLKHAKLIRDTDKIDIFKVHTLHSEIKNKETDEPITNEVIESVKKHTQVDKRYVKNSNDSIVTLFCFIFDMNYNECIEELKINIDEFYNELKRKDIYESIYKEIINYIEMRSKDVRE